MALLLFESKVRFARNLERSQFVSKFAKDWISFYRVNGIFVFYRGKEFYFSARANFFFFFFSSVSFQCLNGKLQTVLASVS